MTKRVTLTKNCYIFCSGNVQGLVEERVLQLHRQPRGQPFRRAMRSPVQLLPLRIGTQRQWRTRYRALQGFGKVKFTYGGLTLGLSQSTLLPLLP